MKLTLSGEQLNFFSRHGFLELEEFIKNVDDLSTSLDAVLSSRIGRGECEGIDRKYGCNIIFEDERIYKALSFSILGKIIHLLTKQSPVRYAFDRFFYPEKCETIEDVSSVSPIIMVAVLALEDGEESPVLWQPFVYTRIPQKKGSVCFVSSKVAWDMQKTGQRCFVVGFTNERASYRFQEGDPYVHVLKKQGYVFGDSLSEKTHPAVYR